MAFETILINAEREQTMPRLLEVAETIATAHRSHIVGLAVLPPSLAPWGHASRKALLISCASTGRSSGRT